ncbi:YwqJ-related putative deaminase [Paenibacillus sp. 481]|uniref:YwqJ-related putative deaminase n=1 Tax=Paenibacillus sp. 481 TaxID=2835869 RepID=UPI001E36AD3F|nr:YwqJ-related putative deaminase [Paenibacillus sp. 481]UHA74777.1 hypothetical protein KIK04_06870 [Paenibacillus sp. 481]
MGIIGFDYLRAASPYGIKRIEDIRMEWRANEHGRLYLRGIVEDTAKVNAALQATADDVIRVYESGRESEKTLFEGIVTSVEMSHLNGVYTIEVEAASASFQLDVKRKKRSFQDTNMTYSALIREIIKTYPGYDVIESVGDGVKLGAPLFQYSETDWAFVKRLASHFSSVVVCDILEAKPRFYFGLPQGKSYTLSDETPYVAAKNLLAFQQAGGSAAGLHDTDFFTYEIESGERYLIGDEIQFRGLRMVVSEVRARMDRGQFIYTYLLSRREGVRQAIIHNDKLAGVSLEGEVLDVKGQQVKLHLEFDQEQSKSTAYWFPFAPPTGNVMYSMPQVGTNASLYVPDATGKRAIVIGCVRKNGGSCAKTSDPNIRYFGTEHGSELELSPTAINVVSGSKEPLSVSFDDKVGVTLTSHKKLTLNADGEISLYTPKRVVVSAQSQIFVKKRNVPSGFAIESEFHFLGENVLLEGQDRTTFPPYNDEPKKGEPPPPPDPEPPFSWGKLAMNVLGGLAVVAVVVAAAALTVATLGAGAVVIGAVVAGAAIGGTAAVASVAVSDVMRGEVSDFGAYAGAAARESVIGAVSGAIFGPLGSMATVGGKMGLGGLTNGVESVIRQTLEGNGFSFKTVLIDTGIGMLTGGLVDPVLGKTIDKVSPWLENGVKNVKKQLNLNQNGGRLVPAHAGGGQGYVNFSKMDDEIPVPTGGRGSGGSNPSKVDDVAEGMGKSNLDNFTSEEIQKLKNHVIEEAQMLKDIGLTNKQLGPAVAGAYDRTTGKIYTAINDVEGKLPKELHPHIEKRIIDMPDDVYDSYSLYTHGAGSHAEVYAANKALLDNQNATLDDILIYVIKPGGTTKPVTDIPFHTCPHCNYILKGFPILSDLKK